MNKDYTKIEELLVDYFRDNLSNEDIDIVEKWIDSSTENRAKAEHLYYIEVLSRTLNVMSTADADASFDIFEQKLRARKNRRVIKHVLSYSRKIAAFLSIPLLATTVYFYLKDSDTSIKDFESQYVEASSSIGMTSKLDLADGTKVWLNSNSKLKYPVDFSSDTRLVELEGEAYFEVEKDLEKPFIVKVSDDYLVKVVGTSFNVIAHEEEDIVETVLLSGVVDLYINNSEEVHRLTPNDKFTYNKENKSFILEKVDAYNQTSWKDGVFIFKSTPMKETLKVLERNYNVKFVTQGSGVDGSIITAKFQRQQLYQILEFLSLASDIEFTMMDDGKGNVEGARKIRITSKKHN